MAIPDFQIVTTGAQNHPECISHKVILFNGSSLVRLMMEDDADVSTVATCDLKKIDTDCFADE